MRRFLIGLLLLGVAAGLFPDSGHAQSSGTALNPSCTTPATITALAAAQAKIVTGVAGQRIYVCVVAWGNTSATATAISFIEGTGTNCATGTLAVFGNTTGSLPVAGSASTNVFTAGGINALFQTQVAGNDLCVIGTAAGSVNVSALVAIQP